ncbi:MAG TPA: glucose 1-dehydrogenase [Aliidongia sp.]|uniref:SDR family NAD(P)-dependent oxidoreductase n=1 Tax=Aliidongia sp. TaxID=1914230 RepID=UPI002DDD4120|nr:glucose 1-dehydrogenase [Aliidongia sp.]HEV2677381.1 glucose 1-dehydrogenase [Aliidongia sp.]
MSPSPSFSLEGRVAVVTGGGGGIGSAAAVALAEAGADIAVVGRNVAKLEQTAAAIRQAGRRALVVEASVTEEASVDAARDAVVAEFGTVDILFNNAGVTSPKLLADLPLDEWRSILDVNLTGAFLCSRAFARPMIAQRHGRIVNMGSILSGRGMATRTAYCASKAGLANFGAALAFELGPHGITVNTIGATVIVTDLNRDLIRTQPHLYDRVLARSALGRLGEVGDVTGVLVFLASPAAGFVTGQTLYVDGGYTAG